VKGVAASSAHGFRTPLGAVPVDVDAVAEVIKLPGVRIDDAAHLPEHGVETHLPFLQEVLNHRATSDSAETQPRWTLIPLLVGDAEPDAIVPILEKFWGGPETLIVISSDLSHFLDHASATAMDRRTADAITALDSDGLAGVGDNSACGRIPLRALLQLAKAKKLRAANLDVRNSGDTAGSRDQVVGYGAFIFS
jgi:AmmeMemoRadiSam system protein B